MDIDELRRLAAKEELSLNYLAKDEMISRMLFHLQSHGCLILKGGTAISRVYLASRRFSENIDFDMVWEGVFQGAVNKVKGMLSGIKDFSCEPPRLTKGLIRIDAFFLNPLQSRDRIMVEFAPLKKASHYSKKIVNYGFVPHPSALMNVYDIEEMVDQKVDCILSRKEGEDFFDLFHLLDVPHKEVSLTAAEKGSLLRRLSLSEKEIKAVANVTNHYLPRGGRPNWGIFLEELKKKVTQTFK
ncbi:nucleotidyl transferase AbiEii/AbiGii toxin family protein [Candidatus Woesearchaeota archaeon]|nr:nucleotidyl transferase AbiEii/AbiGii toxin family protein [Candidatus Woesearchaeota archaeon]